MNIPFRLNLEQQKKRAKELLKGFQQSNKDAVLRFEQSHPKLLHQEQSLDVFSPKLADAQLVIARELHCKSWVHLRNHIILMNACRDQLEEDCPVEDEPTHCLHIRCGNDIQRSLKEAGFAGDFLEFSDPFCVGPVSYDYDLEQRASFLHESYGKEIEQGYHAVYSGLNKTFERLKGSAQKYEHVVLWFEHDAYDQFILVFLLSYYHRYGLPKNLWMVTTDQFPGTDRFLGLGQLPPEALRLLWRNRMQIGGLECAEGDRHWKAFSDPNRAVFHRYVASLDQCLLPYFKEAALRQLQEQPIEQNDLPLTQQLTLDVLRSSGSSKAGFLFREIMEQKEPLPFLGDLMYWHILQEMQAKGLIEFTQPTERLTETDGAEIHWPAIVVSLG